MPKKRKQSAKKSKRLVNSYSSQNESSIQTSISNPVIRSILARLNAMVPENDSLSFDDINFIDNTLCKLREGELDKSALLIRETHEILVCLSKMAFKNFNFPLAVFFDLELNNLVRYLKSENVVNYRPIKSTIYTTNIKNAFQCSLNLLQEYLSLTEEEIIKRPGSLIIDLQKAFDSFSHFFLGGYREGLNSYRSLEAVNLKYQILNKSFEAFKNEYEAYIEKFKTLSLPTGPTAFIEYDCQKMVGYLEEKITQIFPVEFEKKWPEYIIQEQHKGNFSPQQNAANIIMRETVKWIKENNDFHKTGFLINELPELFNKLIGERNVYFYKNLTEPSTLLYASVKFINETNIIVMRGEYYKVFATIALKALQTNQDKAAVIKHEKKLQTFFNHNRNGPFPEINIDALLCWENFPLDYIEYIKKQIINFFTAFADISAQPHELYSDLKNKSLSELSYLVTKQALEALCQEKNPAPEQTKVNFYTFSHCADNFLHLSELENNIVSEVYIKDLALYLTQIVLKIASTPVEIIHTIDPADKFYESLSSLATKIYEVVSNKYSKDSFDSRVHLIPLVTKLFELANDPDRSQLIYAELLKLTNEYLNDEDTIDDLSNSMKWFDLVFEIIADNAFLHEPLSMQAESFHLVFEIYENKIQKIVSLNIKDKKYEELLNQALLTSEKNRPAQFDNMFVTINQLLRQKIKAYNWVSESEKFWKEIKKYDNFIIISEVIEPIYNYFISGFYQGENPFLKDEYKKLTYYKEFFSAKIEPLNLYYFYQISLETYKISKSIFPLDNVIIDHFNFLKIELKNIFQNNSKLEEYQFDLFLMLVTVFLRANNDLFARPFKCFKNFLSEEGGNFLQYIDVLQELSRKIIEAANNYTITIPEILAKQIAKLDKSKLQIKSKIMFIEKKNDLEKPAQHKKNKVPVEESSFLQFIFSEKKKKPKKRKLGFFSAGHDVNEKQKSKSKIAAEIIKTPAVRKGKNSKHVDNNKKASDSVIIMAPLDNEKQPIQQSKYRQKTRSYREVLLADIPRNNAKKEAEKNIPQSLQSPDNTADSGLQRRMYFDESKIITDEFYRQQYPLLQEITHLNNCYNYLYDKVALIKHPFIFKILLDLIEVYYYQIGDKFVNIIGKINRINDVRLNKIHQQFVAQFNKIVEQVQFLPHQGGERHPLSRQLYPIISEINNYHGQNLSLQMQLNQLFTCISRSDDLALYESIKILVNYEPKDANQIDIPLNFYDLNFHILNSQAIEHYRFLAYLVEFYPEQRESNELLSFRKNLGNQHSYIAGCLSTNDSHRWRLLDIQFKYFIDIVEIIPLSYDDLNERLNKLSLDAKNDLTEYYKKIELCFDIQKSLEGCLFLSLPQIIKLIDTLKESVKTYISAMPERIDEHLDELKDSDCQTGPKL